MATLASAMVRPTRRAERKLLASMREEAGRPMGTSMMRFSTSPSSVTMTTSARPGPRWTNSIWRSARSDFGAMTSPAQWDSPASASVAWASTSGRLRPTAAHWPSMDCRSASVSRPSSSSPWTKSRRPRSVGRRPGRGMGGEEQAGILQIGHHIADGRRRQRHAQPARNRARADRLAALDIGGDDMAEDLARALAEVAHGRWGRRYDVHGQERM